MSDRIKRRAAITAQQASADLYALARDQADAALQSPAYLTRTAELEEYAAYSQRDAAWQAQAAREYMGVE
jgi:hypothetical protein